MKRVHETIKPEQKERERKSLEAPVASGGHSAVYKNYLKDIKDASESRGRKYDSEALVHLLDNPNLPE